MDDAFKGKIEKEFAQHLERDYFSPFAQQQDLTKEQLTL